MSRIIKTAQVLRRNWKKSTFFFGVLAYGSTYIIDRYKTFEMMRAYCEEARKYGEIPLPQMKKPKHVTVILNPEANYRKSNVQFEKFAAPLLHLAGFKVSMFQTENEKQAQELMQVMSNTDAVLVAGGDGTLHETVTGLLRRPGVENENLPLGIVPLGKTNTVARYLFGSKSTSNAQLVAEAVMAVIRETTVKLDVLKVQYKDEVQPIYAVSSFEQGIFADVDPLVQKYWYLGALKDKFTYFVNSLKEWKGIEIETLEYVAPCDGCSKCFVPSKRKENSENHRRWWSVFLPKTENKDSSQADLERERILANTVNENCGKQIALVPAYSTLTVTTNVADPKRAEQTNSLWIKIFPKDLSMMQFISSGLSHRIFKHQDPTQTATILNAREVILETEKAVLIDPSNETGLVIETTSSNQTEQGMETTVSNQAELVMETSRSNQTEQGMETTSSNQAEIVIETTSSNQTELTIETVSTNNASTLEMNSNIPESTTETMSSSTSESTSFEQVDLNTMLSSSKQTNSDNPDQIDPIVVTEESNLTSSVSSDETKSSNTTKKTDEKNNVNLETYSYIDKEKYRRASCSISLLPKQVTVYA